MLIRNTLIVFLVLISLNLSGEERKNFSSITNDLKSLGLQVYNQNSKASDVTITDTNGKAINLSGLKGKVVFVNFWASWCPPCKAEMPSIQKLNEAMKNKKFAVVAIDVGEPKQNGLDYYKKSKYAFPIYFDANNEASAKYSVNSIPATYIIDKNGNLVASMIGSFEWDNAKIIKAINDLVSLD